MFNTTQMLETVSRKKASAESTLLNGLLGYWDLDSDALDKSGNGNDMTASGGASNTGSGGPGGTGYYSTTAVAQILETAFTEDFSGGEMTVVHWNYSLGTGVGAYPMCAYSNSGGTSFQVIGATSYSNDQSTINVALNNSVGSFFAGTGSANTASTWNFNVVRVRESDNTATLRQNDVDKASRAWTGSIKDNEIYFGTAAATNRFFNGRHAKVAIWNRILTAEEETYLFNGGAGRLFSEL